MITEGEIDSLVNFKQPHPNTILGPHPAKKRTEIIAFLPLATEAHVQLGNDRLKMTELRDKVFKVHVPGTEKLTEYILEFADGSGDVHRKHDPYAFDPLIVDNDIFMFKKGELMPSYTVFGAHRAEIKGVSGVVFRVWAPTARAVSVVGDFNRWLEGSYPMNNVLDSGIWELFAPDIESGELYKFAVKSDIDGSVILKADPYAFRTQLRPDNASIIDLEPYNWGDGDWLKRRGSNIFQSPLSIYEVHLGSWRREDGKFMNYRDLASLIARHCKNLGFNCIELLPVMEHPLDDSWGYEVTSYFSPTSRHGSPSDFKFFVDTMHQNGLRVILDWVPAHFPADEFGLAVFDGTHLYEHRDPRRGKHPDWGTLIFNYSKTEVRNFLMSSAYFWLREFHADGLRIDAVSSMLYLDYSRRPGEWIPNKYGGNENLEAIDFIRDLNNMVHREFPGAVSIAEESTAWGGVTAPPEKGGLGFDFKWNMGWMHDSLLYFSRDPIYRRYHQGELSFSMVYAYSERYILPLSHDEVVHGKGSLFGKMPGDSWQKYANLRLCFAYMFTFPGKKLLFMGSELAPEREWDFAGQLDWDARDRDGEKGITKLLRDLNFLYMNNPCLSAGDTNSWGFEWIDYSDSENSVISYIRYEESKQSMVICAFNFTPTPRYDYRIGVPSAGDYSELMNTDSSFYGGSNVGNLGHVSADKISMHGREFSVSLTLPPLAAVVLSRVR